MGLFKRRDEKEGAKKNSFSPPELPELPKLPEFPDMSEFRQEGGHEEPLPQLPKFPNSNLRNKFSQNTIKDAITGKEEDEEVFGAEESLEEERKRIPKPLHRYSKEEEDEDEEISPIREPRLMETSQGYVTKNYVTKKAEPIFIRIDKFEESMKIFQEIKSQISEIEDLIRNTKEIKTKEDEELSSWEKEMQSIKDQIEKVNQEIFSRIE